LTLEAERFLDKARECLADARMYQVLVPRIAGREAYLSVYHAAAALVHDRTGKVAKTHRGVRSEFARLTRGDPRVDRALSEFLGQAYELKSIADYGTGSEAIISAETATAAIKTAARFIDCISSLIAGS
jgi:uncharacterized protein (UPF0332 family)